jgi:hypothetical protein
MNCTSVMSPLLQHGHYLTQDLSEFPTVHGAESRDTHKLAFVLWTADGVCMNFKKAPTGAKLGKETLCEEKVTPSSSRGLGFQLPCTCVASIYSIQWSCGFILYLHFSSFCFPVFLSSLLSYITEQSWHILLAPIFLISTFLSKFLSLTYSELL